MEVFIRDEEKDYIFIGYKKNKKYQVGLDMETRVDPEIKSLDQHDAEVRNKVIDELLEWADNEIFYKTGDLKAQFIELYKVRQKLNEMKGGSNE